MGDHRDPKRAELRCRVNSPLDAVLVSRVSPHEQGSVAQLLRHRLALGLVEVADDDLRAGRVQPTRGGGAEPPATARDDRHCSLDVHRSPFD